MAQPPNESTALSGCYPRSLRFLHWAVAVLFGVQVALMVVLHQLQSLDVGRFVLGAHRSVGVVLFLVIAVRIAIAPWVRPPRLGNAVPGWQRTAAAVTHGLLIAGLAIQPLLGIGVAWSRGDDITVLGMVSLPPLVALGGDSAATVERAHTWLAYGLFALLAVHLAAVAFNHFARGAAVMDRILPQQPRTRLTDRLPVAVQLALCCGLTLALAGAAGAYGAAQYRAFKDMHARFDQTEVAALDELRGVQLAHRDIALARAGGPPAAQGPGELAAQLDDLAGRLADADARDAASAAAQSIRTGDAPQVGERLQAAVDSQSARVIQGRLEIDQRAAKGHDLIILTLCPALLIGAVLAFVLARSILTALSRITEVVRSVERGKSLERVEVDGGGDFAVLMRRIDSMRQAVEARERQTAETQRARERELEGAAAVQREREQAQVRAELESAIVEALADALSAVSKGDLRRRIEASFEGGYDRVRLDFNATMASLQSAMERIAATASDVDANSAIVARAASELSRRTEFEALNVRHTSEALEEVMRRLEHSAVSARGAAQVVNAARRESQESDTVVSQAIHAMGEIETASDEIGRIIGVIDDIAFQTNLLALNAGVEAARAGDAGRGFGIIAQEVRALSGSCAQAAKEIKALVRDGRGKVALGSELVDRTGAALRRVLEKVSEVDALVAAIAEASAEQVKGLSKVTEAVGKIDGTVTQNAALAQETTGTAESLTRGAHVLHGLVRRFAGDEDSLRRSAAADSSAGPAGLTDPSAHPGEHRSMRFRTGRRA